MCVSGTLRLFSAEPRDCGPGNLVRAWRPHGEFQHRQLGAASQVTRLPKQLVSLLRAPPPMSNAWDMDRTDAPRKPAQAAGCQSLLWWSWQTCWLQSHCSEACLSLTHTGCPVSLGAGTRALCLHLGWPSPPDRLRGLCTDLCPHNQPPQLNLFVVPSGILCSVARGRATWAPDTMLGKKGDGKAF